MSRLHHEVGGSEGAPTLLLIHPMGGDLRFWDDCRAVWQRRYRCVAVDLPGAGGSPVGEAPLTIENQAEALRGLAETFGPVVPVGCAVGAMVAAVLAARASAPCPALVLANPGFRTREEARAALTVRAATARRDGMGAIAPATIDAIFGGRPLDRRLAAFAERFAAQDAESYARQIEGMLDADISAALDAIACPVLLVPGGRDRLLPPSHAEAIAERLPHAELTLLADGAHFIPYEQPEAFASLVDAFLSRTLGRN